MINKFKSYCKSLIQIIFLGGKKRKREIKRKGKADNNIWRAEKVGVFGTGDDEKNKRMEQLMISKTKTFWQPCLATKGE